MKSGILLAIILIVTVIILQFLIEGQHQNRISHQFNHISIDIGIEGFTTDDQSANFIKKINQTPRLTCYLFYTYNCPHSQQFLKTHWRTLSKKYAHKITFTTIDCLHPATKHLPKLFNVESVPAIIMVKDYPAQNVSIDKIDKSVFAGERNLSNFENFLANEISINEKSKERC